MQYPINFSHIGLSVPDVEKAIEFYKEVFGWYLIAGPWGPMKRDGGPTSQFCDTVYGEDWTAFKLAHMSTGNGIGIELLEFEGSYPAKEWQFKQHGVFHWGVTVPNYEEFIEKLKAKGGRQRSAVNKRDANGQSYVAVYCEDPFGNIFEIFTHSYEVMFKM